MKFALHNNVILQISLVLIFMHHCFCSTLLNLNTIHIVHSLFYTLQKQVALHYSEEQTLTHCVYWDFVADV